MKRFAVYLRQINTGFVEVAAETIEEATKAVKDALEANTLCVRYDESSEEQVDDVQVDEGSDHPEWAEYRIEDGELVEQDD